MGTLIGTQDEDMNPDNSKHIYALNTILHIPTYFHKDFLKEIYEFLQKKS